MGLRFSFQQRALEAEDIPVLLTIQVESVAKRHRNDSMIPANAATFYQSTPRLTVTATER